MRAVNSQAIIDVVAWFFLAYFIAMGAFHLLLNACSLLELPRQLEAGLPALLPRPHERYEPPVSVKLSRLQQLAESPGALESIPTEGTDLRLEVRLQTARRVDGLKPRG